MRTAKEGQAVPSIELVDLVGTNLNRPECVLTNKHGDIFTADWRGGVAHIDRAGQECLYVGRTQDLPEGLRPNGVALEADGSFLLAHLGDTRGGVWRLTRNGQVSPFLIEIDGMALPPTNFIMRDFDGRAWVTVSTTKTPRALDYNSAASTGFLVLVDGSGARVVAEGLGYANECQLSPDRKWIYVNETFTRRLSRFAIEGAGRLGDRQVVYEFGKGQFPDGMAFDTDGNIWVTSIICNELLRIDPDRSTSTVVLCETDEEHVTRVEEAYLAGGLARPHLDNTPAVKLRNLSSIAFAADAPSTAYLGCLLGRSVGRVELPAIGAPLPHWDY